MCIYVRTYTLHHNRYMYIPICVHIIILGFAALITARRMSLPSAISYKMHIAKSEKEPGRARQQQAAHSIW